MRDKLTKTEIAERLLAGEKVTVSWRYDENYVKRYSIDMGKPWERWNANSVKAALRMLGVNVEDFGGMSSREVIDVKNRKAFELGFHYLGNKKSHKRDISHKYFPGDVA